MPTDKESKDISRRSFMKRTAISGVGLALSSDILGPHLLTGAPKSANSTMIGVPFEARERVRLGIIGVGGRGTNLLEDLLAIENVEVKAICDLVPEKVARAQKAVTDAGQAAPKGFSTGELDFKNLTELELDMVYIATPWNWHVPMAISVMKNGKHAAVEVPACTTLQECWELVDTSEATRKHCVILENCCYGSTEMMVLGMVRDGLFGRVKVDEHEAERRLQAQAAAYRLLGPALVVFVAGYWGVCLFGPFEATRSALAVTAVVVTWLAALVLAAPTMIRMWTQPDEPGETAAVAE